MRPNRDQVGYWLRRLAGDIHHVRTSLNGVVTVHNQLVLRIRGVNDTLSILRQTLLEKGQVTDDDLQETYERICAELGVEPQAPLVNGQREKPNHETADEEETTDTEDGVAATAEGSESEASGGEEIPVEAREGVHGAS
jgi:hypothetical protein